jgi:succinate dehydrogenase / fumarate reductase flavoprotein subunit
VVLFVGCVGLICEFDVVVVGGGIAGLCAALSVSGRFRVAVVSKVCVSRSHSGAAQGGLAAALGNEEEDRWVWHMFDTVKGGDYLVDQDAAEVLCGEAVGRVLWLEGLGVPFSRNGVGRIGQRRFGGHTRNFGEGPVRRACYASDRTGRVIMDVLYDHCLLGGVEFFDEVFVTDLLFSGGCCCGVCGFRLASGEVLVFRARAVLLATGGCGRVFKITSTAFASTGDGLALAFGAGVALEDMEFVQFHPTGIYPLGILVSEAARAEGGVLRNGLGERFMERYAPVLKDLAPRDIVSRAILSEVQAGRGVDGKDYVFLDLTGLGREVLGRKLSEVSSFVQTYLGVDAALEPVPVAPTCHYMMGGVPTDVRGRVLRDGLGEVVSGLYAAGECACLSVHGANRLGTNSLLDLVVFGQRAGVDMLRFVEGHDFAALPVDAESVVSARLDALFGSAGSVGLENVSVLRGEMQVAMTGGCSVFRDRAGLEGTLQKIRELRLRYRNVGLSSGGRSFSFELEEALELGNMLVVAEAIVSCSLRREESRGAHFRGDFPVRDDGVWLRHSLVSASPSGLRVGFKPVVISRFEPKERTY